MKLICSATVSDQSERQALLSWVRTVANGGYSEFGTTVTVVCNLEDTEEGDKAARGVIRVFENYPEHSIERREGA